MVLLIFVKGNRSLGLV